MPNDKHAFASLDSNSELCGDEMSKELENSREV
jgi:hypothetical protein